MLTLLQNRSRSKQDMIYTYVVYSGEKEFSRVVSIYGQGGHLVCMTRIIYMYIGSPFL